MNRPVAVAAATETYLADEGGVARFLAECCDRNAASLETAGALYAAWCTHAAAAGEPAGTQRRSAAGLERQGWLCERAGHAREVASELTGKAGLCPFTVLKMKTPWFVCPL